MIGVSEGMPFWASHGTVRVSQRFMKSPSLNGLVAQRMRSLQKALPSWPLSRIASRAGGMPAPGMEIERDHRLAVIRQEC
jgi:hypothetical protein